MEERFGIMHVTIDGGYIRLQGDIRIEDDKIILDGHGYCRAQVKRDMCLVEELEDTDTLIVHVS